jgi:hypothetical protein
MNTTGKPTTRRDLLYLLAQASELEHSLACQYLFTAFSLKERTNEEITPLQQRMIARWRRQIIEIAVQEMLHLALASNLLTAIGGVPYFRRANFPQGKTHTSLSLRFMLAPFGEDTLQRYICFELPQDFQPAPGETDWNEVCAQLTAGPERLLEPLLPKKLDFHSIGELYGLIGEGFVEIETRLQAGGKTLFIGPPGAQATGIFEELTAVKDVASVQQVIDLIVEQGEGTPRDQVNNHFRKFIKILKEYQAERQNNPTFQPARPVVENPLLDLQRDQPDAVRLGANVITDELSRDVVEIFAAVYEVMLQILARYFAHTEEDEEQRYVLKSAFLNLMPFVLSPIGKAITELPAGEGFAGKSAGPSFEVFSDVALLPQMTSAWAYFRERLDEIAAACDSVANDPRAGQPLKDALGKASDALQRIADSTSLQPNGLTWEHGISQLFSPMDLAHMGPLGLDLADYQTVSTQAVDCDNPGRCIWDRISKGEMPMLPLGPWTKQRMGWFKQWIDNNFPE